MQNNHSSKNITGKPCTVVLVVHYNTIIFDYCVITRQASTLTYCYVRNVYLIVQTFTNLQTTALVRVRVNDQLAVLFAFLPLSYQTVRTRGGLRVLADEQSSLHNQQRALVMRCTGQHLCTGRHPRTGHTRDASALKMSCKPMLDSTFRTNRMSTTCQHTIRHTLHSNA